MMPLPSFQLRRTDADSKGSEMDTQVAVDSVWSATPPGNDNSQVIFAVNAGQLA
ncbi:hypothetical protein DPMN_050190 [Dreissena polymorpha]|uniref:Uncharacterized protein n=1 Tax=Dreissena polymorpha TaxID=45954 RepID=A0A9D4HM14_DREPO|nr:hypothetical protein DPMN_050190 [Dreissena polymorpha]